MKIENIEVKNTALSIEAVSLRISTMGPCDDCGEEAAQYHFKMNGKDFSIDAVLGSYCVEKFLCTGLVAA